MFDFGFSELIVIFVVALVVLGPTRLPGLVRKVGRWVGKARAMANDFRQQLESEVNLAELNKMTEQQSQRTTTSETTPAAAAETPAEASLSGTGYPYGVPTDTSSMTEAAGESPHRDDDTFSHAHAEGAAPQPWSPADDGTVPDHAADAAQPAPGEPAVAAEDAAPESGKQVP